MLVEKIEEGEDGMDYQYMKIGNREYQTSGHTYVMGILNVTPDSFSDGGNYTETDRALFHVEQMLEEGADLVEVIRAAPLAMSLTQPTVGMIQISLRMPTRPSGRR